MMESWNLKLKVDEKWTFWLMFILTMSFCSGETDPRDVSAINNLYAALGSPPLAGWVQLGGDPCMEAWEGVLCVNTNITGLALSKSNIGGQLGTMLDSFASIISIDLSDNQFTGCFPDFSALSQLTNLSLTENNLMRQIPDSFQQLSGMISLDLSANSLSGPLPPSMGNLSSLTILLLQDNELTGVLDVLQDLPLSNLNVMNNQFSGPIPPKLLTLPDFRGSGNPFNTTVLPSPPAVSPAGAPNSTLPGDVPSDQTHKKPSNSSSAPEISNPSKSTNNMKMKRTILVAAKVVIILLVIVLGLWFGIARWCKKRQTGDKVSQGHIKNSFEEKRVKPKYGDTVHQTQNQAGKAFQETSIKIPYASSGENKQVADVKQIAPFAASKDAHSVDMTGINVNSKSTQPVPPLRHYSSENITLKPSTPMVTTSAQTPSFPTHVKSFSVASLQQYTNSFSQDNLIGDGIIGSVYRAEMPDGKVVAVKKINNAAERAYGLNIYPRGGVNRVYKEL